MEGSADCAESNLFQCVKVDEAQLSKFMARLDPKLSCTSDFLATLTPKIRDFMANKLVVMVKAYDDAKSKVLAVSKLTPDSDTNTLSHIPNPLGLTGLGVKGSKEAQGEPEWAELASETDQVVEQFRYAMTAQYRKAAELELKVKLRKLRKEFFSLVTSLAATGVKAFITRKSWTLDNLTMREIAGNAVTKMIATAMQDDHFRFLTTTRTECRDEFLSLYFKNGLQTATLKDERIATKVSTALHTLVAECVFKLFTYRNTMKAEAKLEREIGEILEMDQQEEANADVDEVLAQEDSMDTEQLENVVQERVQQATEPLVRELRQVKQMLRAKDTGGEAGQPSGPKSNGRNKKGDSNDSNDSSKGNKSNQQRKQQSRRSRQKGRGKARGSDRGGRGRGSGRS